MKDELLWASVEKVKTLDKFDTEDCLQLETLVRYQQNIMRHVQHIRLNSHVPNAFHIAFFYVVVLFSVVPVGSKQIETVYLNLPLIIISAYLLYVHHTLCEKWQKIDSAEEHFCDTLLELPWYERNIRFQKFYLTCLQLNQKCYPIRFLGLCEVNLKFFADNMKRVYSVVNLLLLKYKL